MSDPEKRDAEALVKEHHPHMSEYMVKWLSIESRIYAGNWAVMILNCKTTGDVKKYLKFLVDDSCKAEDELVKEQAQTKIPNVTKKSRRK